MVVKITDFGLSLHWYEGIVCHHFKGNVKYSSPVMRPPISPKSMSMSMTARLSIAFFFFLFFSFFFFFFFLKEILRARADKNVTLYLYCPQTDVYRYPYCVLFFVVFVWSHHREQPYAHVDMSVHLASQLWIDAVGAGHLHAAVSRCQRSDKNKTNLFICLVSFLLLLY
jgi:hypothetical protein